MSEPTTGSTGPTAVITPSSGGEERTGNSGGPEHLLDEEPRRRISPFRVLVALALLGAAIAAGIIGVRTRLTASGVTASTWFAPYVDTTLTPTYQFQDAADNQARQTILGFVVSDSHASCTPSWGGVYTEDQAAQSLNLDSRIAQVRSEGAQVIASFGGQKGTNLDVGCTNHDALTAAYQSVISRYHLRTIDLDMEGPALDNFASVQRGAAAIRSVQLAARASHAKLDVWLTLPVEPDGLQANALSVITAMLRANVVIGGVNLMTMDLNGVPSGTDMLNAVEEALVATHGQLATLYSRFGTTETSRQLWSRMGATVMIGQSNIAGQQFTIADAQGLTGFASRTGLGRTSMWSINRDSQCGSTFSMTGVMSTTCSGVAQSRLEFSSVFSHLKGSATEGSTKGGPATVAAADTNPADAPYPLWQPSVPYQTGYKVVRQGYIYQATWYNQGEDPSSQVQYQWQTPWTLLGPVVAGDHPPKLPTLPAGTYPGWSAAQNYTSGDRVLLGGLPYQAKWSSLGASPATEAFDPSSSPWQPLFTIPGEPATTG